MKRIYFACPVLFACGLSIVSHAEERGAKGDSILGAIDTLEGARDPKCHATAARLENFMYGTPLCGEARFEKNRLLKILARRIWESAPAPSESGTIGPDEIRSGMAEFMKASKDKKGDQVLRFPGNAPVTVTARDFAHYGSVAYSLRAILTVRQETILDPKSKLRPLSAEAVGEFKSLLDLVERHT